MCEFSQICELLLGKLHVTWVTEIGQLIEDQFNKLSKMWQLYGRGLTRQSVLVNVTYSVDKLHHAVFTGQTKDHQTLHDADDDEAAAALCSWTAL